MIAGSKFRHDVDAMEPGPEYAANVDAGNFMDNAALRRSPAAPGGEPTRLRHSGKETPPPGGGVVMGREKAGA